MKASTKIAVLLLMLIAFFALGIRLFLRIGKGSVSRLPDHPWFFSRTGDHKPLIMAHQGGEGERPGNTMVAFQHAVEVGAEILDTDMQTTGDGVLILLHDASVDRTTNGKGTVVAMNYAQIAQLDAAYNYSEDGGRTFPYRGQGIRIPTVEELFRQFPGRRFGIEIKRSPALQTARVFCALIRKYKMENNVLVSSFGQQNMDAFRASCPEVATSATTSEVIEFLRLNFLGLTGLASPKYTSFQVPERSGFTQVITPSFLDAARKRNLRVLPWTINDEQDLKHVIAMNVDAINTDYPSRLARLLAH